MPPHTDEQTRRNVIRQWILGFTRDTIAAENNIGTGTVSSIIANYKAGLEDLDFDSIRQLAVEARQHGLNFTDLALHFRLHNYLIKSGQAIEKIESFIANISSSDVSAEKIIELLNDLFSISKAESIPLDQIPNYIERKLDQKQKIDEEIHQANAVLQSKNVSTEAINQHIQLNEKLNEHGLSMHNIDELLNLLLNAREYAFDSKKIIGKLRSIKRLEKKEKGLENNCTILTKQLQKYKKIIPLAERIVAMNIDISELLALDTAVNQIAIQYNLPLPVAAFRLFSDIRDYNKIGGMKKELSRLCQQICVVNGVCSNQTKAMTALVKLKSWNNGRPDTIFVQLFGKEWI